MFLRKLTVILLPLVMLFVLCMLIPLFVSMDAFFGPLLTGTVLGVLLALLLPLSGATRIREPFAWLLWIPAAVILLVLIYQFLTVNGIGQDLPVLRLLAVRKTGSSITIITESAFASYMLAFSIRTGKGI